MVARDKPEPEPKRKPGKIRWKTVILAILLICAAGIPVSICLNRDGQDVQDDRDNRLYILKILKILGIRVQTVWENKDLTLQPHL